MEGRVKGIKGRQTDPDRRREGRHQPLVRLPEPLRVQLQLFAAAEPRRAAAAAAAAFCGCQSGCGGVALAAESVAGLKHADHGAVRPAAGPHGDGEEGFAHDQGGGRRGGFGGGVGLVGPPVDLREGVGANGQAGGDRTGGIATAVPGRQPGEKMQGGCKHTTDRPTHPPAFPHRRPLHIAHVRHSPTTTTTVTQNTLIHPPPPPVFRAPRRLSLWLPCCRIPPFRTPASPRAAPARSAASAAPAPGAPPTRRSAAPAARRTLHPPTPAGQLSGTWPSTLLSSRLLSSSSTSPSPSRPPSSHSLLPPSPSPPPTSNSTFAVARTFARPTLARPTETARAPAAPRRRRRTSSASSTCSRTRGSLAISRRSAPPSGSPRPAAGAGVGAAVSTRAATAARRVSNSPRLSPAWAAAGRLRKRS